MANERKIKKGSTEELVQVLRFVPRTYTIELTGYGGEIVMGKVKRETYDYLRDNEIHIEELVDDYDNDIQIAPEHQLFRSGAWYDCNDLCHEVGVEFSNGGAVTVYDENGDEVWTSSLDPLVLKNSGCRADVHNFFDTDSLPTGSVVFVGQTFEKGTFFKGEIDLREPFDHKKLGFGYASVNSWNIGSGVEYDDEYVENEEMDTTIRGTEYELIVVEAITTPGIQASDYEPRDWELSGELSGKVKPVYTGWYQCVYTTDDFSTAIGKLMWIGDTWMMYHRNKLVEVTNVRTWQGLNWDTSDMANRPTRKTQ